MAEQTITTAATGRASSVPDQADLGFSAKATAENAADARQAVAEQAGQLRQGLEDVGIPEEQIRTYRFRVRQRDPDRRGPNEEADPEAEPFDATESIRVILFDLDRLGDTLAAVDQAGVEVDGVDFTFQTETHRALQREATEDAVQTARKKAAAAAAAEDLTVGEVRSIVTDDATSRHRARSTQLSASRQEAGAVQSGPIEVNVAVEVEYGLREE